MKLLYCPNVLYLSSRSSRHSVIQYRRRKELLKDYKIVKPGDEVENIYSKLASDLKQIVPISPKKTSITIDILGEETLPKLSQWRRHNLIKRARRVLSLPISLTTDDKIGQTWKQRFVNSLAQKEKKENKNLLDQVPNFVKLMMENDSESFKNAYPEIYSKYQNLILYSQKTTDKTNSVKSAVDIYFPFVSTLENVTDRSNSKELKSFDETIENKLLDEEYVNYLKHHELLQYFASSLKDVDHKEYEPEIEGWTSQFWLRNYAKPDPSIPPSDIPCSGCGAHLHCVSTNIPGFVSSQKFTLFSQEELRVQLCQRCEFLKKYNVALNVTSSVDEYPKLISEIQKKKSLVIIMVDLLDFPCSVWPGIINLIGEKHRIYIVGTKVDLLPKDDNLYLERIKKSLKESLKLSGIGRDTKIRDVSLISAKTGFGIENLVTKLIRDIKPFEDIYLVGCTNSGKSTLFNVLMQSDLCALRDGDLMARATTSLWPGTTLNLLKFPVKQLAGWELELRLKRLNISEKHDIAERRLKWTMHRQSNDNQFAQLSERVGTSFRSDLPIKVDGDHPFAKKHGNNIRPFNPNNPHFKNCSFLNDTPGVIYKDQLLHLLTTEELLRTIPREIITPRTYTLRPLQSLFIGGLARLDLTHARQHVWVTVFASHYLPVNIVYTEQAKNFYEIYLGSDMLAVPYGDQKRLEHWPRMLPKEFRLDCIGWEESCADVVLSTAGWVSITSGPDTECVLRAFTPEGRGIYIRNPPMLPFAVRLKGKRIPNTPCFENKLFTIDDLTENAIPKRFHRNKETQHISQDRIKKAIHFVGSYQKNTRSIGE